jgi:gliding motility-associated-like protein
LKISANSQTKPSLVCGDDKLIELQRQLSPIYDQRIQENNLVLKEYIKQSFTQSNNRTFGVNGVPPSGMGLPEDSIYTIPVVIHIVYPSGESYGTGTNISYAQIRSQIEALNAAFSMSYPIYNGQSHPDYAKNAKIRFCLARKTLSANVSWADGPGGVEYGVIRYPDTLGAYNHLISVSSANQLLSITHPTHNYFPFDKYLNIWLVKNIDGGNNVMGYAPRPLMGNYPLDGIVLRADIFGDNSTGENFPLGFNLMEGKILSHEMGHYLNLYHIFQGGCSGANGVGAAIDACDLYGDYICDIKPCTTQNVFCNNVNYNTCTANYDPGTTTNDMINDYMSYADDGCMNTFTQNQVQRMWATLQLQRQSLWQSDNLSNTGVLGNYGCVPAYLNSAIHVDNAVFCVGTQIHFSNPLAGNTAISYQWQFLGASPSASNSDTVSVTYNTAGNYKVILTVSDGSRSRSDSLTFTVTTCKLDSSLQYMAHWYFGDYCSLDFSTGTPVKTTTAFTNNTIHSEYAYPGQVLPFISGTISLCDSSGNLLFYSNGINIWNSSHKKISSSSIFGVSDINASTGICYVPFPGQPNKYFIVGVYPNFDGRPSGIRYVLVDIAANIVSSYQEFQHPLLPKRFSEYLTVVPHCNGTDYWIIVKGFGTDNDNNFYSLQISSKGIENSQAPIVSSGFNHPAYTGSGMELKANRAGDKLIITTFTNNAAALYDFDNRTGEVKNEKEIPNVNGYSNVQSGTTFSPNGDFFYLMRSSNFATNGPPYWLFQYRVNDLTYNVISTNGFYFSSAFQNGPDNKLYITNTGKYLARLTNPDDWGGGTFEDQFIDFSRPNVSQPVNSSLPAFIDAKRKDPLQPDFTIFNTSCSTYSFSVLCFENYIATWDFGDNSLSQTGNTVNHIYSKSGVFEVKLSLSNSIKTFGTTVKKIIVLPLSMGITGSDFVCTINNFASQYFAPTIPNVEYRWSVINGAISGSAKLPYVGVTWQKTNTDSGKIMLQVSSGNSCSINETKTVKIVQSPSLNWVLQDSICITSQPILLNAFPSGGTFFGKGVNNGIFNPDSAGLGNHILSYSYGNGTICKSEIQKIIKVNDGCNVSILLNNNIIPNVFSPNGDGINDTWKIKYLGTYPDAIVDVFNRYGQLVFHSIGYNTEWDGKYNGVDLPLGTYFYIIKLNQQKIPLNGSITILR